MESQEADLRVGELIESVHTQFSQAELFYGHGTDNAWDEAVALVLGATGFADDDTVLRNTVSESGVRKILTLAERRVTERIPLPYLLGRCWFAGFEFLVEPEVIIPRSPIAELIINQFKPWLAAPPARVLDLCCGGGCIGIATALVFPDVEVVMVDIDDKAVDLARRNMALHGVQARVEVFQGDLYDPVLGQFDLIVTNPPYVDAAELAAMPDEYRHEPLRALDGGEHGLDLVMRILGGAKRRLTPRGVLIGEVGASAGALALAAPSIPFVWVELEAGGEGLFVLDRADLP